MKHILLSLLLVLMGQAQIVFQTNTTVGGDSYSVITYYPQYYFTPVVSNRFSFPPYPLVYPQTGFPAFAVKTNSSPMKISGLLRVTYNVIASSNAVFRFGGQGTWNTGSTPPHARLFFSTRVGYGNEDGCPKCSWYSSQGWQELSNGTFVIEALIEPSGWTDSGAYVLNPPITSWEQAVTNVMEVGLCFGGGSFYDIGCAMTSGEAQFELVSIQDFPLVNVGVETSNNLTNWEPVSNFTIIATNDATFYRFNIHD